jgi:hypothetical protein
VVDGDRDGVCGGAAVSRVGVADHASNAFVIPNPRVLFAG